jgi:hypothetical protein
LLPRRLQLSRMSFPAQLHTRLRANTPNHAMQRTSGRRGSSLSMKFHPQPAATRHSASRR